jgi:hypothetical protein
MLVAQRALRAVTHQYLGLKAFTRWVTGEVTTRDVVEYERGLSYKEAYHRFFEEQWFASDEPDRGAIRSPHHPAIKEHDVKVSSSHGD